MPEANQLTTDLDRKAASTDLQVSKQKEITTHRMILDLIEKRKKAPQKSNAPENVVQTLEAPPLSEDVSLTQDSSTSSAPTWQKSQNDNESEQVTQDTTPPLATPETGQELAQAKSQTIQTQINPNNPQTEAAIKQQTELLQQEISALKTSYTEKRREEKRKKIEKEFAKLTFTSPALFTVIYYTLKITLLTTLFPPKGPESKKIAAQIKEKQTALLDLQKPRIRR